MAAAVIHGAAAPEHFNEWWGYGIFFLLAATGQVFYGILLFVEPWKYDQRGRIREGGARKTRSYSLLGIAGNSAIVALYLLTRTVGIPFFGPEAGQVEPVTVIGLVSKAVEIWLIACLVRLMRSIPPPGAYDTGRARE